jgi:hypothetical protein
MTQWPGGAKGPVRSVSSTTVSDLPEGKDSQRTTAADHEDVVSTHRADEIVCTAAVQVAEENGVPYQSRTVVTFSRFREPVYIVAPRPIATVRRDG